ncbi:MAG: S-adenosylmethionine:tRNA ribosyltransferase-isomerase [Bacteroidota bacterium]
MHQKKINIKDFSYDLPDERIAKFPMPDRDQSKLLVYKNDAITENIFSHIDEYLPNDSLIVFNNTKVIHARLLFQKPTGAQIEIFCLEPLDHNDFQLSFNSKKSCQWKCLIGNLKRWKEADEILVKNIQSPIGNIELKAERIEKTEDAFKIKFSWQPEELHFAEVLHHAGVLPLPPYLNRKNIDSDEERYQTVYAKHEGSVAAPTAGLHFTESVFGKLKQKNIQQLFLTLHVGAGTFKPIKTDTLSEHVMHEETVSISRNSLEEILNHLVQKKSIIAVGTTSTRTLESIYWHGVQLITGKAKSEMHISQWTPYENLENNFSCIESIEAILKNLASNNLDELQGSTQIIIAPGYQFKIVDILITNFHQPENTLILLIAAFVGESWRKIYDHALQNNFRFLSYGDSSVLFR